MSSKTVHGETALHKAALHGSFKNVNLLLKAGTDVNAQAEYYNTPLIMVTALDCDDAFLQSGREAGAKINIINQDNLNAVRTHIRSSLVLYRKLNARILKVLLVAGETKSCTRTDMTYFPSVLKDLFLEQMRPASLKHLCRCVINQKTSAESG